MDAHQQKRPISGELQTKKCRKLDTVKCERCRNDKQKCNPPSRIWPEKCNRCSLNGLSCSEGKRAERISRNISNKQSLSAHSKDLASSEAEERFQSWSFLSRYHKNISLLFDHFEGLQTAMVLLFGIDDPWKYNRASECTLLSRFVKNDIEPLVSSLTIEQLATCSHLPSLPGTILPSLVYTQYRDTNYRSCPICEETGTDRTILQMLQMADDSIGEFHARQERLLRHCSKDSDIFAAQQKKDLVTLELKHYWASSVAAIEKASSALLKLNLHELANIPGRIGLYHPVTLATLLFFAKDQPPTSLGQNVIHQWFDSSSDEPSEYHLTGLLLRLPRTNINQQDILGRSPLHIACQKGWKTAVDWLLRNGALTGLLTVFDSLPLHYAACNGDSYTCGELLEYRGKSTMNKKDCQGYTPLHYAQINHHAEVVELLSGVSPSESSEQNQAEVPDIASILNLDWYLAELGNHIPEK